MSLFNHPAHFLILLALVTTISILYSFLSYHPRISDHGWRGVTPGAAHHSILILSGVALLLLLGLSMWAPFMSSNRLPVLIGLPLLGVCFICAVGSIMAIRRQAVQWRDGHLLFHSRSAGRVVYAFEQIVDLRTSSGASSVLHFDDGVALRLDTMSRGAEQLIQDVETHRFWGQAEREFEEAGPSR